MARAKRNINVDEQDLRSALSKFTTRERDQKSAFVYLNVYDSAGQFLFQLYRDPAGKIVRDKAEYY